MPITRVLCVGGKIAWLLMRPGQVNFLSHHYCAFGLWRAPFTVPELPPSLPIEGGAALLRAHQCVVWVSSLHHHLFFWRQGPLFTTFSTSSSRTLSQFLPQWHEALAHTQFSAPPCLWLAKVTGDMAVTKSVALPLLWSALTLALTGWVDSSFSPEILSPVLWYIALLLFQPNCSFCIQLTSTMSFAFFSDFFHCILSLADIQPPPWL